MTHGTRYGYRKGCRCDECRAEALAYKHQWRKQNPEAYARELARGRAYKEGNRGTCRECGKRTTGCHGPGKAPTLCISCNGRAMGGRNRGKGPAQAKVLEFLAKHEEAQVWQIEDALDMTRVHISVTTNTLLRHGLIERVARGRYRRAA